MSSDFFTPIVKKEKQHFNFVQMTEDKHSAVKDTFNQWAKGFVDRDGKLIKEFQTTFNSTFWEVYLHAIFKEGGHSVDYSYDRPDFVVKKDDIEFCVEAVISNHRRGDVPEWHHDTFNDGMIKSKTPEQYALMNKSAMIRHWNAVLSKWKQYAKNYSKLDHVKDKPFVIAVGAYDNPDAWEEMDRAIMATLFDFYLDEQEFFDGEYLIGEEVPIKSLGAVKNHNNADICLGLFNSPKLEDISAVAFSCTSTMGKLRALSPIGEGVNIFSYTWMTESGPLYNTSMQGQEVLGDGLMIFHNPFAKRPLPKEAFMIDGVAQFFFDEEDVNGYTTYANGQRMMQRCTARLNFVNRIR